MVQLGSVARVGAGQGAPQDRAAFSKDGHPFIRAGSLELLCEGDDSALERIDDKAATKHGLRLYSPDTIVFAKSGMSATKNRIYRLRNPAYVVNHLATVQPTKDLDPTYLRYWLEHFNPTRLIQDIAYPSISLEDINEVVFPLFSLSDQQRLAGQLEEADRLRRTRRYALELSDTFLPAAFLELFGDPIRNSKHWPIESFGEVVENFDSGRKPVKEADRARRHGDYPYYGASGIIDYIDGFLFDGTYLLVAEDGMNLVTRSKPVAIVASGQFWVNNHAHVVAPKAFVDIAYLREFTNSRNLNDFVTGIDQMKLTRDNLDRIPVPLPPLPLQQKFAAMVERVERLRSVQRESLRQAEHLFQSLLHHAFTT
jgi:type I restriction enzyme S subunit